MITETVNIEPKSLESVIADLGTPGLLPDTYQELSDKRVGGYLTQISSELAKKVESDIFSKKYGRDGVRTRMAYGNLKVVCGGISDQENAVLVFGRPEDNKPVGIFVQGLGDLLEAYHMFSAVGDEIFYWDRKKRQFVNRRIEKSEEIIEIADAISKLKYVEQEEKSKFS